MYFHHHCSEHGGYVTGITLDLVENKQIVLPWRGKDWPKGVYPSVQPPRLKAAGQSKT